MPEMTPDERARFEAVKGKIEREMKKAIEPYVVGKLVADETSLAVAKEECARMLELVPALVNPPPELASYTLRQLFAGTQSKVHGSWWTEKRDPAPKPTVINVPYHAISWWKVNNAKEEK